MSRHLRPLSRIAFVVGGTAAALLAASGIANAVARTPTITGNSWVALLVIAVLVGTIYVLIMGTLHVEKRDARLGGGGRRRGDDGWFGIFPSSPDEEEDAPDYQRHDGGEGGGGGEGAS